MKALVLDDDPAVTQLIGDIAQTSGLDVILTTNGGDFRSALKPQHPDVVVLDLALADTDGVQQLRYLKSENYSNAIILISGFDKRVLATTEALARKLDLRIVGALSKPLRAHTLRDIFDRLKLAGDPLTGERLLAAIHDNELVLEYQPVVRRRRDAVVGVEALVRWNHPKLGRIMPGKFMALAEGDQAIVDPLTEWVIATAIRDYVGLHDIGIDLPMAINVSGVNLHDLEFPDRLYARLQTAGVPRSHFTLEITESAASQDPVRVMEILSRVRLNGVTLAIDDFGTGYSSLKQLHEMPFSALKIDGSFVMGATTSPDSLVIVKAVAALAQALGLQSIAECVENDETAHLLESIGVDALQGYLIAPPMPVLALPEWMLGRAIAPID